jgi:sterol desaturase/sphingolipid hydroxylase (fatty acid hydroxylase superfamily)
MVNLSENDCNETEIANTKFENLSINAIPLVFAIIFLAYFIFSLFVMEIVKSPSTTICLVGSLCITDFTKIHEVFFRYSIVGGLVVPIIFLIELICVGWKRSSIRAITDRTNLSGRSDLICFILCHIRWYGILQTIFTFGFVLISGEMISSYLNINSIIGISAVNFPMLVTYIFYVVLYSLFDYIAHRVNHSQYFWPLHRFHHAAETFDVFTSDRGHPASALVQTCLKIFPMAVLGVPADAMVDVGMLFIVINYLNHSRIDWDFGWFGRYVIQSPRHHQLHHSLADTPCNFSVFPLWDRLGGTWQDVTPQPITLGTSTPYRHGAFIMTDILRDYRDFWRGLLLGARQLAAAIGRRKRELPPDQGANTRPLAADAAETGGRTAVG